VTLTDVDGHSGYLKFYYIQDLGKYSIHQLGYA